MLCYKAGKTIWECVSRSRHHDDGVDASTLLRHLSLLGLMHSPYPRRPLKEEAAAVPPCCEGG